MQYVVLLLFASICYFLIIRIMFLISFLSLFSYFVYLCPILCILCFCIALCIVCTFVQVYRPLPPGGNPIPVNKYHIILLFLCPTTLIVPNVKKIQGINLPGTPWATSACCGRPLPFLLLFLCKHRHAHSLPLNSNSLFFLAVSLS